jgi:hypothetical protein
VILGAKIRKWWDVGAGKFSQLKGIFQRPFVKFVITNKRIKLIVYEPLLETIEQWIP